MSTNDPVRQFFEERAADIEAMRRDEDLRRKSVDWLVHADRYKYTYNFTWMGRPIIKAPADIVVQQELMWRLKPDLVVETGIAHGGSLVFMASMMELTGGSGEVVGVDIDIRAHNRSLIESHPMAHRIRMYEGNSVDPEIVRRVRAHADGKRCVLLVLDSLHTHEHVLAELRAYADLVTVGSYCVLPDTFIEFFPTGHYAAARPWDVGNNPYTAMRQFLAETDRFEVDEALSSKAMITETVDGYLHRVR